MSVTAEEVRRRFKEPWLRYGLCAKICRSYGLPRAAWRKMAGNVASREPDEFCGWRLYSRDEVIVVIEKTMPDSSAGRQNGHQGL